MSEHHAGTHGQNRFRPILRDVHFWVPMAVLLAGLLVLHWLH